MLGRLIKNRPCLPSLLLQQARGYQLGVKEVEPWLYSESPLAEVKIIPCHHAVHAGAQYSHDAGAHTAQQLVPESSCGRDRAAEGVAEQLAGVRPSNERPTLPYSVSRVACCYC